VVRVGVYIDGFNLYHGLKQKHGRKYLWLDLQTLAGGLLKPGQILTKVVYFTARVRNDPIGVQRQSDYIDTLRDQCPLVTVIEGRFQEKNRRCRHCGTGWVVYEEKETDVNIAIALVEDAVADEYDTAIIISADSDLCPAVRSVRRLSPTKRIVAAFPPRRQSGELQRATDGSFTIGDAKFRQAQLPASVTTVAGVVLSRPSHWS
jgi:uncharacterized LabA/DUF88 family protein